MSDEAAHAASREPRLFAVFCFRHDADLVPGLLDNLGAAVDDYVAYDDRGSRSAWQHEGRRQRLALERARERGAEWVLCLDPDERLEDGGARVIRQAIRTDQPVVYGFRLRELWTPTAYRVDGLWRRKRKWALFPLRPGQEFADEFLHNRWAPVNPEYRREMLDVNVYHLRMIDEERRVQRRDFYNRIDPEGAYQSIGYDYMTDETGLVVEEIPEGRGFHPAYVPGSVPPSDPASDPAARRDRR